MVNAPLPLLAKSQPFTERQRRIEHLHVNAEPLAATRAFRQDVLEDGAADTGVAVLRQQRDVDDPDLPRLAGDIEASDGLAVPEDDQKIAGQTRSARKRLEESGRSRPRRSTRR